MTSAECLEAGFVNNELQFDASCAAYYDITFAFTFRYTGNGVFEPNLSTLKASEGAPCLNIEADLSIPLFCLNCLGTKYRFNLTYLDGSDGRWPLAPSENGAAIKRSDASGVENETNTDSCYMPNWQMAREPIFVRHVRWGKVGICL